MVQKTHRDTFLLPIINQIVVFLWHGVADLTITSPTSSPRDTVVRVKMAEIWGGCKIHKVSGSRGFDLGVTGEQGRPGSYASQADLGR